MGTTQWFATAEYYGCTVFAIVGKKYVSIGHIRQEGRGGCPLATVAGTNNQIIPDLVEQTVSFEDFSDSCDEDQRYAIIFGSERDPPLRPGQTAQTGVPALKEFFEDNFEIPADNIKYQFYIGSSGSGTRPGPFGKMLIKWDSPGLDDQGNPSGGTLQVLVASEQPRLKLVYNADGTLNGAPLVAAVRGI
jgi:hypothetical protein